MAKINQIGYNIINNGMSLYTKRTCLDNSDIYINSKLKRLTDQTMSFKGIHASKKNLRKLIEGNNFDETI
ncbi:hypothetical protein IJ670_04045 [bacterium]|nr:hypothetical protein [bacterium]